METCLQEDSKAGARDRAMIPLAWQLGSRVHEIAGLSMIGYQPGRGHSSRVLRAHHRERQQAAPSHTQAGGKCRPLSQGLVGGPGRGTWGAFLFHFLSRKPEKAGQESDPENAAQHFEGLGRSVRPPTHHLARFPPHHPERRDRQVRPHHRPAPGRSQFLRHHGALRPFVEGECSGGHKLPAGCPIPHWCGP